jgi:hypothetical protein
MKPQKVYGKENHSFNPIEEASLLLNNEVKVTSPQSTMWGEVGIVSRIMHDGRTLDVELYCGKRVFLDITLVDEVRDTPTPPVGVGAEQSLGPDANSVLPENRL